jgi:hypothetical protein
VHLFRPSLGFLVEAQVRLENRRRQKALFARGAHNVFRVRLGKNFEKHELIVNFEVIFDRCQTEKLLYFTISFLAFSLLKRQKQKKKNKKAARLFIVG